MLLIYQKLLQYIIRKELIPIYFLAIIRGDGAGASMVDISSKPASMGQACHPGHVFSV